MVSLRLGPHVWSHSVSPTFCLFARDWREERNPETTHAAQGQNDGFHPGREFLTVTRSSVDSSVKPSTWFQGQPPIKEMRAARGWWRTPTRPLDPSVVGHPTNCLTMPQTHRPCTVPSQGPHQRGRIFPSPLPCHAFAAQSCGGKKCSSCRRRQPRRPKVMALHLDAC